MSLSLVMFEDISKGFTDALCEKNELNQLPKKDYLNYKKKRSFAARPESTMSNYSSSSKVWTFLRGKEMSPRDEMMTLRELTQASPANSVIEAMDEELTWKLRDFHSKRNVNEKLYKRHNPSGAEKENGQEAHSNSESNNTGRSTSNDQSLSSRETTDRSSNGPTKDSTSNGREDELKTTAGDREESACEEYQGIIYIGGYRNQHPHNRVPNVFAIAKSISNVDEAVLKTNLSDGHLFVNYFKLFPMRICQDHLDSVMKQSNLSVEVWTRYSNDQDVKLGTASVGLHPFYVAFRSEVVRTRLFDLSMPVIAMDGWAMVQDASGATIGQLEVTLAMGTKRQIEFFVQSKDLLNRRMETPPVSARSAETATSILSSFLENLSQQMAANKGNSAEQPTEPKRGELRKTSDLLDILQKSLTAPPPTPADNGAVANGRNVKPSDSVDGHDESREFLKICLEIESAMHLPKVIKGDLAARKTGQATDEEPSSYATFEARVTNANNRDLVDSVEGRVFATNVVEKTSNPVWNKQFTVEIPKDLLTHVS